MSSNNELIRNFNQAFNELQNEQRASADVDLLKAQIQELQATIAELHRVERRVVEPVVDNSPPLILEKRQNTGYSFTKCDLIADDEHTPKTINNQLVRMEQRAVLIPKDPVPVAATQLVRMEQRAVPIPKDPVPVALVRMEQRAVPIPKDPVPVALVRMEQRAVPISKDPVPLSLYLKNHCLPLKNCGAPLDTPAYADDSRQEPTMLNQWVPVGFKFNNEQPRKRFAEFDDDTPLKNFCQQDEEERKPYIKQQQQENGFLKETIRTETKQHITQNFYTPEGEYQTSRVENNKKETVQTFILPAGVTNIKTQYELLETRYK
jgi:hypothetical protein